MPANARLLGSLVLLTMVACEKGTEPPPARKEIAPASRGAAPTAVPKGMASMPVTHGAAPTATSQDAMRKDVGIEWAVPPHWKLVPSPSTMRVATYAVPGPSPETGGGELAVFYFGPRQGGNVESNLQRWAAQFQDVPEGSILRSERKTNGLTQHVIEVPRGTYSNSMRPGASGEPQSNYGLLGAVVSAPSGNYFLKLTAPSETLKAQRETFLGLLDSIKAKQP